MSEYQVPKRSQVTVELPKELIDYGKRVAKLHGIPLNKLVENGLRELIIEDSELVFEAIAEERQKLDQSEEWLKSVVANEPTKP